MKNRGWITVEIVLLACIVGLGMLLKVSFGVATFKREYNKYPDRGIARINVILNDIDLEEIKAGSKDIKYDGNEVEIYNDGAILKYDGVEVKGRGNSTWLQPKKPFQLKFKDSIDLLGLGKARKWVLLANYLDKSFIRNDAAFLLAEMLDEEYNSRGKFVELYFDGEYEGLYYLTHKIEISKNSVDLREEDGALFEIDTLHKGEENCHTTHLGSCLFVSDIVIDDLEQEKIIASSFYKRFDELEKAAEEGDYKKIRELIDIESFVKYFLISEFTVNPDAYSSSFYLYSDGLNDNIHAGPVWDFDLALGNRMWSWQVDEKFFFPEETMIRKREAFGEGGLKEDLNISKLFYYLMDIPEFKNEVEKVFREKMSGEKEAYIKSLKEKADEIREAAIKDGEKWGRTDYDDSVEELIEWIERRYDHFEMEYGNNKNHLLEQFSVLLAKHTYENFL